MGRVSVALLGLALLHVCVALYKSGGPVTLLTKQNFGAEVILSDTPYIVEFFAPWCGHCKQLAPTYTEVGTKLKGLVGVGAIDCDQEKELCGMFGIKGFPTLKLFGTERTKKQGQPWKEPTDYNGARSAGAIGSAGLALLNDKHIKLVTKAASDLKAVLPESKKAVLLFSQKAEASNLFKALSLQYASRGLPFVLVPEKGNAATAKEFGVTTFPTLLVVNGGSGDASHDVYKGKFSADALQTFLDKHAQPKAKPERQESTAAPTPKPVEYDQKMEEITTAEQFEGKCLSKPGFCAVAFLDPEEDEERHKRFVSVLEELLKKVYRNYKVMWVNAPQHYSFFQKFNLGGGFPNLAIYTPTKKRVVPFKGGFNLEDLTEFADKVTTGRISSYEVSDVKFD